MSRCCAPARLTAASKMCAFPIFLTRRIAFLRFEPIDQGLHGRVRGAVLGGKRFLNLADRRGPVRPERFHHLHFELRQFGCGHPSPMLVLRSTTSVVFDQVAIEEGPARAGPIGADAFECGNGWRRPQPMKRTAIAGRYQ